MLKNFRRESGCDLTTPHPSGILWSHCGVEQWQLVGLITRRSQVRVLPPLPIRTHPEPREEAIEQFLAMLRFEQRSRLAELPVDLEKGGSG
jgi:hypothetical protein